MDVIFAGGQPYASAGDPLVTRDQLRDSDRDTLCGDPQDQSRWLSEGRTTKMPFAL